MSVHLVSKPRGRCGHGTDRGEWGGGGGGGGGEGKEGRGRIRQNHLDKLLWALTITIYDNISHPCRGPKPTPALDLVSAPDPNPPQHGSHLVSRTGREGLVKLLHKNIMGCSMPQSYLISYWPVQDTHEKIQSAQWSYIYSYVYRTVSCLTGV